MHFLIDFHLCIYQRLILSWHSLNAKNNNQSNTVQCKILTGVYFDVFDAFQLDRQYLTRQILLSVYRCIVKDSHHPSKI